MSLCSILPFHGIHPKASQLAIYTPISHLNSNKNRTYLSQYLSNSFTNTHYLFLKSFLYPPGGGMFVVKVSSYGIWLLKRCFLFKYVIKLNLSFFTSKNLSALIFSQNHRHDDVLNKVPVIKLSDIPQVVGPFRDFVLDKGLADTFKA